MKSLSKATANSRYQFGCLTSCPKKKTQLYGKKKPTRKTGRFLNRELTPINKNLARKLSQIFLHRANININFNIMSNNLVKITKLDDGEEVEKSAQKWCATHFADTSRVICSGDALDASSKYEYKNKTTKRGGITCKECIAAIKEIKNIKF